MSDARVTLVTGAGSGLGAASSRRASRDGAKVVVVDIDGAAAERVSASLPGDSIAVAADVSDAAAVDEYMSAGVEAFGRIDRYHLNAGVMGSFDPFPLLEVEDFDRVMAVNVRGVFLGLRAAFRRFAVQESGGAIVITASIASLRGSHDVIAYQTSKHADLGLLRGAAMYGGPLGIRVNAVAPGLIPTELHAAAIDQPGGGSDIHRRGSTVPMRRTGVPDEVAGAVAYLLSDDASYVNGEVLSVDGGSAIVSSVRPAGGAGAWDPSDMDAHARDAAETVRRESDS